MLSTHKERSGFHGFGDSEYDIQAMIEQVFVQLTTLHHNHRNDKNIPFSEKVRASHIMRALASVFNDYAYESITPTREILGIYDEIQIERDYPTLARLANKLLKKVAELVFTERAIKTRVYRYHHRGD